MESEYEIIISEGGKRRGRKPLPPEERERRRAFQKEQNRLRQEARRRAYLVLQHRYNAEFESLFQLEYLTLSKRTETSAKTDIPA